MQYIEPRSATITIEKIVINGTLSGSLDSVVFESQDGIFLSLFPEGKFDSLYLNESNCNRLQLDIVETAKELVRLALK